MHYQYRNVGGEHVVLDPRGDHFATVASEGAARELIAKADALSSGGAFVALAPMLIPLIPPAIAGITSVVKAIAGAIGAIKQDPMTPEEQKIKLDAMEARLVASLDDLQQVELPPPGSGR